MSIDTVISISILVFLTFVIWRLNRTSVTPKNKINFSQHKNHRKSVHHAKVSAQAKTLQSLDEPETAKPEYKLPLAFLDLKLIGSGKFSAKQQQMMTEISRSFRKPHPLLLPLAQGSFEPNELFDLIKSDAEMTAKILNAVNSPLFSLRQPITNINHAIIYLGITQVKNIAIQLAVQSNIAFEDKAQNMAFKQLWTASYLASSFCLLLAKELNEDNAAELSTHCLLSYLGDLAILSYQSSIASLYREDCFLFERVETFQETMDTNPAVIGMNLAQQWQLPKSIAVGISNSLLPLVNGVADQELSHEQVRGSILCYLSCRLADLVAFGNVNEASKFGALNFEVLGKVEFYYLQSNLEQAGLDRINEIVNDMSFIRKLNKVIAQVSV